MPKIKNHLGRCLDVYRELETHPPWVDRWLMWFEYSSFIEVPCKKIYIYIYYKSVGPKPPVHLVKMKGDDVRIWDSTFGMIQLLFGSHVELKTI